MIKTPKPKAMLAILDGWGINPKREGNAVALANTPYLNHLFANYPHTQLICSGEDVGLPEGVMGNSEVGHLNIGAGRVVYQDVVRINKSIREKAFFKNPAFTKLIQDIKQKNSALHLIGLLSDAAVHSHTNHLFALLDLAKEQGLKKVYVHAITDGRDTPPDSGIMYVTQLQEYMKKNGCGAIATICGRYYAMDRDKRWDRVTQAYQLYTQGKGIIERDPVKAMENSYQRKETDEFVKPILIANQDNKPLGIMSSGDGVIFYNFRADRAREISAALTDPKFDKFAREKTVDFSGYVTMTMYDESFELPIAFEPVRLTNIFGKVVSDAGLTQLRIAETEKYAHVTYFFNGGDEQPFPNEDRKLIPSPKEVATYDLKPEMSAPKVAEELLACIRSDKYDIIVVNFANMDMVGHTGILEAAIKAVETVDKCLSKVIPEVLSKGGLVFVTADHGNAEKMIDDDGKMFTAHTTNPVPFVYVDEKRQDIKLRSGILADIIPTVLEAIGLEKPKEMTGMSLVE